MAIVHCLEKKSGAPSIAVVTPLDIQADPRDIKPGL
jgi:hypothetical protein